MKDDTNKLLINAAAVAAIYLLVGKPILNFLGITKSKIDKDYQDQLQSVNSPFGVAFWRLYFYTAGAPANGRKPLTTQMVNNAKKAAKILYNAFGYFKDNEDEVLQAFQICGNKVTVSLMSTILTTDYNTSLLGLLKYGKNLTPQNGLNDKEMEDILNLVKNFKIY